MASTRVCHNALALGLAILAATVVHAGVDLPSHRPFLAEDVPSLDELSSDWLSAEDGLRDFPELSNFWGSAGVARDSIGFARNAMPPFAATASDFPGNDDWLLVDGVAPKVSEFKWTAYEASRRATVSTGGASSLRSTLSRPGARGMATVATVESAMRMQFEGRAAMMSVRVEGSGTHNLTMTLRGMVRELGTGFGWAVPYPTQDDAKDFTSSLPRYTTTDSKSSGVSMFTFVGTARPAHSAICEDGLKFCTDFGAVELPFSFQYVWLVGNDTAIMNVEADRFSHRDEFDEEWSGAKGRWEERWRDAFTPKPGGRGRMDGYHHSGHLPMLRTSDADIKRIYYMAALTLLCVQRTNSPQHPRVYITGGQGTSQFFWDAAQHSYLQSMLDPSSVRAQLAAAFRTDWHKYYGVQVDDGAEFGYYYAFSAHSIFNIADAYLRLTNDTDFLHSRIDGVPRLLPNDPYITPMPIPGGRAKSCDLGGLWNPPSLEVPLVLRWNARSSSYVARAVQPDYDGWGSFNVTMGEAGDTTVEYWKGEGPGIGDLVSRHTGHMSPDCNRMVLDNGEWDRVIVDSVPVIEILSRLALDWRNYQRPSADPGYVRIDWSDEINSFLECVPNYMSAVPALHGASVWMMRSMAALSDALKDSEAAMMYRQNATSLETTVMERLYVAGSGFYACGTGAEESWTRIDVRHIVDFDYVGHFMTRYPSQMEDSARKEMVRFALRELITSDYKWARALSKQDGAAPSPLVQRADHGTTGAYDAWVSLAVEALADVSGDFTESLKLLRGTVAATREGCYGNNHFINNEGLPIKTLNNGVYIADNGANFGDVIVRTLFGYDPAWLMSRAGEQAGEGLYMAGTPRGDFIGELVNVPLPGGVARLGTVAAGQGGVRLTVQQ